MATKDAAQYQKNIQRVADVLAAGANISQASVEELAVALEDMAVVVGLPVLMGLVVQEERQEKVRT